MVWAAGIGMLVGEEQVPAVLRGHLSQGIHVGVAARVEREVVESVMSEGVLGCIQKR